LDTSRKEYILTLENEQPLEPNIEGIFETIKKEFEGISISSKPLKRELIPTEICLSITLSITADMSAAVTIKLLERLWQQLNKEKISAKTYPIDAVQSSAERYLIATGIRDFTLIKRQDKGPYVNFIFADKKGANYLFSITSFDLKIISFTKKRRK